MSLRAALAFALSGFAGVLHEVLWIRLVGDLFGSTAQAVHTVLAVFFAGAAAGSAASDRLRVRPQAMLRLFAVIEFGLAAFALAFPWLVSAVTPLHDAVTPLGESGPGSASRLLIGAVLLAIPTALMGAAFPLLVRWISAGGAGRVALLYAVNTGGGALGAAASAFALLPLLGVRGALAAGAAANAAAALLALTARRNGSRPSPCATRTRPRCPRLAWPRCSSRRASSRCRSRCSGPAPSTRSSQAPCIRSRPFWRCSWPASAGERLPAGRS